jgi:4-azaleucine resistance transporter AzlC
VAALNPPSRFVTTRDGFVAILPLWLGVAPFGVAYALAARAAGLGTAETMGMSLIVFAGASQLAAAELFGQGASAASIILSTLVINSRHLLPSAALAPYLRHLGRLHRGALAFLLTDESFAVSVRRVQRGNGGAAFLWGASLSLYLCWQLSTAAGLLLGQAIPDPSVIGLHLVFPLSFIALLVPSLRSRPAWAAAVSAGSTALGVRLLLPDSTWHVVIGAVAGSLVGALLDGRR